MEKDAARGEAVNSSPVVTPRKRDLAPFAARLLRAEAREGFSDAIPVPITAAPRWGCPGSLPVGRRWSETHHTQTR
jgi:hypothetical protein